MELVYASERIRTQCTSLKAANRLFGGDSHLAISLLARINALEKADTIKDIVVQPTFHFHSLQNKNGKDLTGYFAIDVKSRREQWRIILQPLDENKEPFHPCHIDQISSYVRIVEITEVSKHYE
ncbi:MAG: hypothetical protein ACI4PG_11330 [Candidatus Ventricola sp.]